jgi:hypothetical protein
MFYTNLYILVPEYAILTRCIRLRDVIACANFKCNDKSRPYKRRPTIRLRGNRRRLMSRYTVLGLEDEVERSNYDYSKLRRKGKKKKKIVKVNLCIFT